MKKNSLILLLAYLVIILCVVGYAVVSNIENIQKIEIRIEQAAKEAERKDRTIDLQDSLLKSTRKDMELHQQRISDLEKVLYEKDSLIIRQKQKIYVQKKQLSEYQQNSHLYTLPHSDLEKRYRTN